MHRISKEPARDSRQAEKRKKKPDKSRNSSLMAASAEGRLLTNPNEIQVGQVLSVILVDSCDCVVIVCVCGSGWRKSGIVGKSSRYIEVFRCSGV